MGNIHMTQDEFDRAIEVKCEELKNSIKHLILIETTIGAGILTLLVPETSLGLEEDAALEDLLQKIKPKMKDALVNRVQAVIRKELGVK